MMQLEKDKLKQKQLDLKGKQEVYKDKLKEEKMLSIEDLLMKFLKELP